MNRYISRRVNHQTQTNAQQANPQQDTTYNNNNDDDNVIDAEFTKAA